MNEWNRGYFQALTGMLLVQKSRKISLFMGGAGD